MKNLRDILIVVAVGATLFFPADADAGPFKKRKAKREAKRATTVQYTSPDCTITGCPIHSTPGTGQLRVNKKGGFTGQLSDQYYADYYAQRTAAAPEPTPAAAPTEVQVVPETAAQISIVVAPAGTVADAQAAVESAEAALAEAKDAAALAVIAKQQADAREAVQVQKQIEQLQRDIEALSARQKELQPDGE